MTKQFATGGLALAFLLAGCGGSGGEGNNAAAAGGPPQLTQIAAPNDGDWRETVTQTEQGGYLLGNPDAPVKLVEYASLTCPHCRQFSADATQSLRDDYIRSGQVSWEFRNYVMGGPDMALSVLTRCLPPSAFFRTVEQIFEQQSELTGRIDENEIRQISAMPADQQLAPIARAMELDTFFARRGLPEARFNQCLADRDAVIGLTDGTARAYNQEQVQGTPTFFVNGEKLNVSDWRELEPILRARASR